MTSLKLWQFFISAIVIVILSVLGYISAQHMEPAKQSTSSSSTSPSSGSSDISAYLNSLEIKGRAPKTGYNRDQFGGGWTHMDGCDTRDIVLKRDLTGTTIGSDGCTVQSGILSDPYTGKSISFQRGANTSSAVQIDHVVALSDAWQTGAQYMTPLQRESFANDPDELLAVDGPTNQKKGDGDTATWLPPNVKYRCMYITKQIQIKKKYSLWVTQAEHDAMQDVISTC